MQAVILAAGQSSRLFPFGGSLHKGALSLMGKSLIRRTIEALRDKGINDIIIVISAGNGIEETLRNEAVDRTGIRFVFHEGARGMGEALLEASDLLDNDFLLLHAHHFECGDFLQSLIGQKKAMHADGAVLIREEEKPQHFGVVRLDGQRVVEVVEKPEKIAEKKRIVGMYLLSSLFLRTLQAAEKHHYSFETALNDFVKTHTLAGVMTTNKTLTLKYPWDILDTAEYLLARIEDNIDKAALIAKTAVVDGNVVIEKGARIDEGAVIKGPCFIGEHAYIGTNAIVRDGVVVEKNAVVGASMEIKHSIIMEKATTHSGYIGDSVIGRHVKIAALFCSGNVRIDRKDVSVNVKGENIDSGRRALGVFVGDETKIGIRVSTMPGVLIGQRVVVGPSTTVFKNIASDTKYYTKVTEIIEEAEDGTKKIKVMKKKKIVLFDIDYTLFDTEKFKATNLTKYSLYDEVVSVLGEIGAYAILGIFSEGEEEFQKAKLLETAIESHFSSEDVHIVQKKDDSIDRVMSAYKGMTVFLVDDRLEVLRKVKDSFPNIFTIWVKRGPFAASQNPIEGFIPDADVEDLRMVLSLVAGA